MRSRYSDPSQFVVALIVSAFASTSVESFAGVAASPSDRPAPATIAIHANFPGGNIRLHSVEPGRVHLGPDLRGDRDWFYWCFEATALTTGRVEFVFPEKVAGFTNGAIGYQGPAVSRDGGRNWNWLGTQTVNGSRFHYTFHKPGESVRLAVTIPYVQANLDRFLKQHAKNPHLQISSLTRSRQERDVLLLRIGAPGPQRKAVILTGRHHAAETMASYVMEGFLAEALADNANGRQFRKNYFLYVVPIVDRDGVENGDQGKNRRPHDHNRDYGDESIYPEIQAIKQLADKVNFEYALDFHCPTLVMKDHQVMYFVGAKTRPPQNENNVKLFAARIKNELPASAPVGPLVWLRDERHPSPKSSRFFGFRKESVMSATFEFPFAPPGRKTDPASCRQYGAGILAAFASTKFIDERSP